MNADEYLKLVENWKDPNPTPVLEQHEGIWVVRDDLLPAGAKSRFLDVLINDPNVNEWVYGSSPRVGYGQVSLAYVACKYGKFSTVFVPASKEMHPNSVKAQSFGAKVIQVPTGFMKVCEARARAYINDIRMEGSGQPQLVPFGLDAPSVMGSIIKVARSLPIVPDEVWTVAGSGTLSRGLQLAWPNANVHMVSVGHKLTPEEIGRGQMIRHALKFEQACKKGDLPPFPSVPEYDAKAWAHIPKNPNSTTLFWNVAG
jgi:hypothetical protein